MPSLTRTLIFGFFVHSRAQRQNLKLQFTCSNGTEGAEISRKIPNTESFTVELLKKAILNSDF